MNTFAKPEKGLTYGFSHSRVGDAGFVVRVDVESSGPASSVARGVAARLTLVDGNKKVSLNRSSRGSSESTRGKNARHERHGAEERLHIKDGVKPPRDEQKWQEADQGSECELDNCCPDVLMKARKSNS